MIILANQAPCEVDGTDFRYVPMACMDAARELFGVEPRWCPQGPAVRAELARQLDAEGITAFDMPGIIDVDTWVLERTGFRSNMPVIGRHSRDNWTKWPGDRVSLSDAYPDAQDFDVRILGGSQTARAVLRTRGDPPNWLVYDYNEVDVRSFLFQIDFYVYFPHPSMIEAFGRTILEALASGCLTILPTISRPRSEMARFTALPVKCRRSSVPITPTRSFSLARADVPSNEFVTSTATIPTST